MNIMESAPSTHLFDAEVTDSILVITSRRDLRELESQQVEADSKRFSAGLASMGMSKAWWSIFRGPTTSARRLWVSSSAF